MKDSFLNLDKSIVDEAIRRVLEMRVNRGIKTKLFSKVKSLRKSNWRDDNAIIKKHHIKKAA